MLKLKAMISQHDSQNSAAAALGQKIKQARRSAGLSQRELGEALELSDKAISAYEQGRAMPNVPQLRTLSKVVEQPVTYFIDPVDIDTPQTRLAEELKEMRGELKAVQTKLDTELQAIREAVESLKE